MSWELQLELARAQLTLDPQSKQRAGRHEYRLRPSQSEIAHRRPIDCDHVVADPDSRSRGRGVRFHLFDSKSITAVRQSEGEATQIFGHCVGEMASADEKLV